MEKISMTRLVAECAAVVEQVARTGEGVTILHDGKAIAQIVPVRLSAHEQHELDAASGTGTLDLDDDVIEAEELAEMEETNREWDAVNSAIGRDLADAPAVARKNQVAGKKPKTRSKAVAEADKRSKAAKPTAKPRSRKN